MKKSHETMNKMSETTSLNKKNKTTGDLSLQMNSDNGMSESGNVRQEASHGIDPQILEEMIDLDEIMKRQATINIGTIGHVAHGKSTIVKRLSGVSTIRHKAEKKNGITIKLGYANAKIFRCQNPECLPPKCFQAHGGNAGEDVLCRHCGGMMKLIRHVSFVDCPGHEMLMSTMLTGAAVMDGAILTIAADEPCPRPQTAEHLVAAEIMKLKNLIVVQNKVDLFLNSFQRVSANRDEIGEFVSGTIAKNAPIIPISAQMDIGLDVLCEYICTKIPPPVVDLSSAPKMVVVRSFDVNQPGTEISNLVGGVAGGSILQGVFYVGMEVEIRPGLITTDTPSKKKKKKRKGAKNEKRKFKCSPFRTKIVSLFAEKATLKLAVPGGLIGVGTNLDPILCQKDRLAGQVIGAPNTLPDVFTELVVKYRLLRTVVGASEEEGEANFKVSKPVLGSILQLTVGSVCPEATVVDVLAKNEIRLSLDSPVCCEIGEGVAFSQNGRLIGHGEILDGDALCLEG
eukprot:CAMPEP_0201490470 /NCGR_PEP_ID=MMETSP0151_2-20130828/26573_1 /ASSEMBLY_ACC=CAM_ASM_000257 /TAXON_ID=200890 /ORGANISM="Paramoeba atlantica, Strain 621/1 / CCAP 1560/9" /LENGTH=511 /DNA_ID=CAMNT_0047876441 /DNA_START=54 /DNA_END=1589 /DNA_ORIENTATION=-